MDLSTEKIEMEIPEEDTLSQLAQYFGMCKRRKGLILGLGVFLSGALLLWSSEQVPEFESTAKVVIDRVVPKLLNTEVEQSLGMAQSSQQFETHIKLLTSYPVVEATVNELVNSGVVESQPGRSPMKKFLSRVEPVWLKEARTQWLESFQNLIKRFTSKFDRAPAIKKQEVESTVSTKENKIEFPDKKERGPVESLRGSIKAESEPGTNLINIKVRSVDPVYAAKAANTLTTVYIEKMLETQIKATRSASNWFTNNLDDLRRKVESSEEALFDYRSKHGLVNVSNQQGIAEQKLQQLNSAMIGAEVKRTETQTRFQHIEEILGRLKKDQQEHLMNSADVESLSQILNSPAIQDLHSKETQLFVDIAKLSEKYGHLHPEMIRAQTELKEVQTQIVAEAKNAYKGVRNEYQLALAQEKAAREKLAEQKKEKLLLDKIAVKANLLEREANSNRQLYDLFLKQMRETDLSTELKRTSNIYLAEPAFPNFNPVKPQPVRNALLGLLAGLGLGVGLALFLECWDWTLKSPEDVEHYLPGLIFLGWLPLLKGKAKKSVSRLVQKDPLHPTSERYRQIRTSIVFATGGQNGTSIIVTSPGEGEGKTTLSANLAIAMAQLEQNKVVLIDCDLRRPRLKTIFGLKNEDGKLKGLLQYLVDEVEINEILHPTDVPNLAVIPGGGIPPNPIELLLSPKMSMLMEWCHKNQYYVILDAPPILAVADALATAPQVTGGVVLVVSAGDTQRDAAKEAVQRLQNNGLKLVGIVMQKVAEKRMPNHYKKYGGYYMSQKKPKAKFFWSFSKR